MTSSRSRLTGAAIFAAAISLFLNSSTVRAESPLAGIKIAAEQTPGGKMFYTATNASGAYSFTKLPPGNYILHVPNQSNKTVAASGGKITGQMVLPARVAKAANANARTKVTEGKRYVWVPAATGSNIGGNWVEVGQVSEDLHAGDLMESEQRRNLSRQRPGN